MARRGLAEAAVRVEFRREHSTPGLCTRRVVCGFVVHFRGVHAGHRSQIEIGSGASVGRFRNPRGRNRV